MLIVQKYGEPPSVPSTGCRTSRARCLATARQGHQVAVVVSAMSGETTAARADAAATRRSERPRGRLIISTGEQVSVGLVALAIRKLGGKRARYSATVQDRHGQLVLAGADRLDRLTTPIKDALADGEIAVIAGFQGVDERAASPRSVAVARTPPASRSPPP